MPGGAGAASPPGAVDVVSRAPGRVEVDDARDVWHMEPPGGHIGGDERLHPAGSESLQGTLALSLAPVPVERRGQHPGHAELVGEPVGAMAGATEDDRPPVLGD